MRAISARAKPDALPTRVVRAKTWRLNEERWTRVPARFAIAFVHTRTHPHRGDSTTPARSFGRMSNLSPFGGGKNPPWVRNAGESSTRGRSLPFGDPRTRTGHHLGRRVQYDNVAEFLSAADLRASRQATFNLSCKRATSFAMFRSKNRSRFSDDL